MGDLFNGDEDGDVDFRINEKYAEKYSTWRSKEFSRHWDDVNKGKRKREMDSDTSEDDEEAKNVGFFEKGFFQTMAWLKKDDPSKYDQYTRYFPDPSSLPSTSKNKQDKPYVLRDYERNLILEKEGKLSDDEEMPEEDPRSLSPTYVEEQKALKNSFKQALENSDAEEEKDIGNLFTKKKKTNAEIKKEEEDYREWLKGRKKELKDKKTANELKVLQDYWSNPNLNSEEVFLRDYILNHKFLDSQDADYQPSYNEIVHDSCDLDADLQYVNEMDEFEKKYNFRFEDPDQEFIKRYPRSVETSLRRKDDRRKTKRHEIKERKEAEKEAKREEIKQLKAIKRKEILDKIEKIKQITGNDDVNFQDEDFEEEFNPEKHDQKMRELFNDDYYQIEEGDKPECPELEKDLEIENWENWRGKDAEDEQINGYTEEDTWGEPESEAPDFNMDCDYDPKKQLQEELIRMTKSQKKQRRRSKFAAALAKEKPVFDPNDKKFEEYFDEYYKLDCEDIIGDIPCRFKYRQTTPNDYGLTVDEILRADVKELNKWCSLRKVVKYKPDNVEKYELQEFKKKAQNEALKRKILPSLYVSTPDDNWQENGFENSGTRRNKKRKGDVSNATLESAPDDSLQENGFENSGTGRRNKKRKGNFLNATLERSEVEVASSTGTTKKKRNKKIKLGKNANDNEQPEKNQTSSKNSINNYSPENSVKQKKNRLKKGKSFNVKESITSESYPNSLIQKTEVDNQTKKKKNKVQNSPSDIPISDNRLKAYGIHPKKFKNKMKYGNSKNGWK